MIWRKIASLPGTVSKGKRYTDKATGTSYEVRLIHNNLAMLMPVRR